MGYRPDLNEVLPAPNFLPGLVLKEQMRRDPMTDELLPEWSVDLDRTLSNLREKEKTESLWLRTIQMRQSIIVGSGK